MFIACIVILVLIIGLYLTAIAPDGSRRERMEAYRGTRFAHRGYHCKERGIPENSMAAFRAAIKKDYGIELDIHLTSDHQVIVFHDDTLKRVCGKKGTPESLPASKLRRLSLLGTSEHMPFLEEVLTLVDGRVPLLIELKMPDRSTQLCERAYHILEKYHGPYLIQSFNPEGLKWFREHAPHVLRGQLSSDLIKGNSDKPWLHRFLAKHLLVNFWGRPDFISYKMSDLPTLTTTILRRFFGVPFAVWTLRSRKALREGIQHYDMQIFEKTPEIY